jgi:hypothetical protein
MDGFLGVADGFVIAGGLAIAIGSAADSDVSDSDEPGMDCTLTISPG